MSDIDEDVDSSLVNTIAPENVMDRSPKHTQIHLLPHMYQDSKQIAESTVR